MNLEIAAYARGKNIFPAFNPGPQPIPKRKPILFTPNMTKNKTDLQKIVQKLRHSSQQRQESHNKQLEMFVNRQRFLQNENIHNEYDRLRSTGHTAPGLQPFLDSRIEELKNIMVN